MKIERISENQIRCTLDRSDLHERQIELSELAYGSEKARRLFQEMIQEAAAEVDFHVDNMPLMVEAIPLNMDSIMLIVTRVEDPDELDTRFSRFSPNTEEEWDDVNDLSELASGLLEGAAIMKELAAKAGNNTPAAAPSPTASRPSQRSAEPAAHLHDTPGFHIFTFRSLDEAAAAAAALNGVILVHSTLYKNPATASYELCIHRGQNDDAFRRTCNTLSEYGTLKASSANTLAYCEEHCEVIIASRALDKLIKLG